MNGPCLLALRTLKSSKSSRKNTFSLNRSKSKWSSSWIIIQTWNREALSWRRIWTWWWRKTCSNTIRWWKKSTIRERERGPWKVVKRGENLKIFRRIWGTTKRGFKARWGWRRTRRFINIMLSNNSYGICRARWNEKSWCSLGGW